MNAYWMNELVHEAATCNPWIAGIATVVAIVKLNK